MPYIRIKVPEDYDESQYDLWEPEYRDVLDHGHVGLIDYMGSDSAIVNAARVSYAGGTKAVSTDQNLIRYLMRHRHTTPFEMVEFKFHVKAPIFVFRQWHRHRTGSINEMSARYSVLTDEMYIPAPENAASQSTVNKQGRGGVLTDSEYDALILALNEAFMKAYNTYEYLLEGKKLPEELERRRLWIEDSAMNAIRQARQDHPEQKWTEQDIEDKIKEWYETNEFAVFDENYEGLTRELARIVLPVATYSEMYWKVNLKNLMHFISLRSDPHAQYEISAYSDAILDMITPYVPWAIQAFKDYQMEGSSFSKAELTTIRSMVQESGFDKYNIESIMKDSGASKREIKEFMEKLYEST